MGKGIKDPNRILIHSTTDKGATSKGQERKIELNTCFESSSLAKLAGLLDWQCQKFFARWHRWHQNPEVNRAAL